MIPSYRSTGHGSISCQREMMDFRILLYVIWHAYGEKCLSFARKIAVRKEPSNRLVGLVYYIRLKIAIGLAHEALRAFNYANHYIDA